MSIKPIDKILPLLKNVRRSGQSWSARCPAHQDRHNSLSVSEGKDGRALVKCHAGCKTKDILKAIGLTMKDLFVAQPKSSTRVNKLTLEELAKAKEIPAEFLKTLGVHEDLTGVLIPFFDKNGNLIREQKRISLTGQRFYWKGKGPIIPYGLWLLKEKDIIENLFITEGISDCWTLLYTKYSSIGIPGNNMEKVITSEHLQGINGLYLIEQSDEGGKTFIANMLSRLKKIGWQGNTWVIKIQLAGKGIKDLNDLFTHDKETFNENLAKLINQAKTLEEKKAQPNPKSHVVIYNLADLQHEVLPEPNWAVDEVIPQGLTIFAAKPKMGKTCLLVQCGLSIAYGGFALGQIQVIQGDVLAITLEENKRRLQEKVRLMMEGLEQTDWPSNFHFALEWRRLEQGGLEDIEAWLNLHKNARLVFIDTFARVKSPLRKGENIYERDYESVQGLIRLTNDYNVAIAVTYHLRKYASADEDPVESVSGSTGFTGAVDTILVLKRERGRQDAVLDVTGRGIEEKKLALKFQFPCWTLLGNAEEFKLSQERQAIIEILRESKRPTSPTEIRDLLEEKGIKRTYDNVKQFLSRMAREGLIRAEGRGEYSV